jgi:hypothetical protein
MSLRSAFLLLAMVAVFAVAAPGTAHADYRSGYVCYVNYWPKGQFSYAALMINIYEQPHCQGNYVASATYFSVEATNLVGQHYTIDELLAVYQSLVEAAIHGARVDFYDYSNSYSPVSIEYY